MEGQYMSMMKKVFKYVFNKRFRFHINASKGLYNRWSDERFIKKKWKLLMGYDLDLVHPHTFNEKLQYLKLNDRNQIYTTMVDKYAVKEYVSNIIGEEYIVPTYGVWESFDKIDFDSLPNQFVLKCTHDSGGVVICRNKALFDKREAKRRLNKCLKRNYYWVGREWPYKKVKPVIFAEQYIEDQESSKTSRNLNVYKIFTINGKPILIQTIQNDKQPNETIDYFDCEWNLLQMKQNFPNNDNPLPKPKTLETMLILAEKLAKGFVNLRVDFYEANGQVYFSEFTFFSDSGFARFDPPEWDLKLGEMIDLSGIA